MDKEVKISREEKVANSAERQLLALKRAENTKIEEVKTERNKMVALKRTLSAIIYAAGNGFLSVYPQAGGFIEGRIKTLDSVEIKTRNEITEILEQIEENPNIDQEEILKKISEIDFKDLFALSVITTDTPEHFKTGSDEKNKDFTVLSSEIKTSKGRIAEHDEFINDAKKQVIMLTNIIANLREKEKSTITEEEKNRQISEKRRDLLSRGRFMNEETFDKYLEELMNLSKLDIKEDIEKEILEKTELLNNVKNNVDYGKKNLERTVVVRDNDLRDLQYKMSEYYVENLSKFSTFKFWGTTPIRKPKKIVKPGFRAVNTGYRVTFTDLENAKTTMKFEAQGKGYYDYLDAEFSALGAEYHEAQKTKDGIISKNIEMPDFTIIGKELTNKIEKEIETKYSDINSIDELMELGMNSDVIELTRYNQKISKEIQEKDGTNNLTQKEIKRKMLQAFLATKEICIQRDIEEKVNECIDMMADSDSFDKIISKNEQNKLIYKEERLKIIDNNKTNSRKKEKLSDKEIDHMARVRTLYRIKEREIKDYAETSIPMFFRADLPKNGKEELMVYWFSTGESMYRFFINRLNGLKDENGKYKYEPQKQQKIALLKLTGLFEDDENSFYTYDKKSNSFGGLKSGKEQNER